MKTINTGNYEAWLLDHFEGRLSAEEQEQLRAFVLAHPELNIDLSPGPLPVLPEQEELFDHHSLLKDEPDEQEIQVISYLEGDLKEAEKREFEKRLNNDAALSKLVKVFASMQVKAGTESMEKRVLYRDLPTATEEQVLRFTEGLMGAQEEMVFARELETSSGLRDLVKQFGLCELKADETVVFENPERLLKTTKVISLGRKLWLRGAAAAAVLLVAFMVLWNNEPKPSEVATIKQGPVEQPVKQVAPVPEASITPKARQLAQSVAGRPEPIKKKIVQVQEQKTETPAPVQDTADQPEREEEKLIAVIDTAGSEPLAAAPVRKDSTEVITSLEGLVFTEDEEEPTGKRRGFWPVAIRVADQVRKLGVRGIDSEKEDDAYRLTINAVSVEKKF